MTPEKRREISSLGGKAVRPEQRSFSQNRELAREAGRKGGIQPKRKLATLAVDSTSADDSNTVPRGTARVTHG